MQLLAAYKPHNTIRSMCNKFQTDSFKIKRPPTQILQTPTQNKTTHSKRVYV